MNKRKNINHSTKKEIISTKFRQKDWVKKLETLSGKPITPSKVQRTIYLLIDCSGSMAGENIKQAKDGAIGYYREAQKKGYSVGLIKFSSSAEHLLKPQNEDTKLISAIQKMYTSGSTNMSDAIRMATEKLGRNGERIICIVTDGMPDNESATLDEANNAKSLGIDIMTIGTDNADKTFLQKLATRKELSIKVVREQLENGICPKNEECKNLAQRFS